MPICGSDSFTSTQPLRLVVLWRSLPETGADIILVRMSRLAEVEAVVPQFSLGELAELEQVVRKARMAKMKGSSGSALDLPPLDLGRVLKPLGTRDEWYDEMLEGRG